MTIRPYGDGALLVELDRLDKIMMLAGRLRRAPIPGVTDVVPAAQTILIRFDPSRTTCQAVAGALGEIDTDPAPHQPRPEPGAAVELPVIYDGADLDEVGRLTGLGAAGVITAHSEATWTVAFCGFAPGFAYCVGSDPRLRVPRRSTSRTRVPAGSVALADEFTGVYPRASPGGWQLLGRTDAILWDLDRNPPALLTPGTTVRFRAVP